MKRIVFAISALLTIAPHSASANPVDFIFGAGSFGRKAGTTADCRNLIQRYVENTAFFKDETWKNRVVEEPNPNYLDDLEFLNETRYQNSTLGSVDTRFDKELDTQIFFTPTAKPRPDGSIPPVDPEGKALVIYLHGSGTKKASGEGFAGKMNTLAKMGYSTLSFDLPFHRLGSRNPALANAEEFAAYMDQMISKYRVDGQPVILVGHSFGPDIIAEYIARYPKSVDSAVLISPGSFDKVTKKWYEEKTSKMDFGDTEMNDAGGRWAGMVTNGKIWDKPAKRIDPTVANKDLDIYVISGDKEEYVPGPLKENGMPADGPRTYDVKKAFEGYFSRVDVTIEPGIGHYIFNHKDANGHDVVLRSVLRANGESLADEKALKVAFNDRMSASPMTDNMARKYSKDRFFRAYIDQLAEKDGKSGISYIQEVRSSADNKTANQHITDFTQVEKRRVALLDDNIRKSNEWAPAFYAQNKDEILALGQKGNDDTTIRAKYHAFLEESQATRSASSSPRVPASVYELPKKENAAVAGVPEVSADVKRSIMSDKELKMFVVGHDSSERAAVINTIGNLKTKEPALTNAQLIERAQSQLNKVEVSPDMKRSIMSDNDLRTFVVGQDSSKRNNFIEAIGALKTKEPTLSNDEVIKRVQVEMGN